MEKIGAARSEYESYRQRILNQNKGELYYFDREVDYFKEEFFDWPISSFGEQPIITLFMQRKLIRGKGWYSMHLESNKIAIYFPFYYCGYKIEVE